MSDNRLFAPLLVLTFDQTEQIRFRSTGMVKFAADSIHQDPSVALQILKGLAAAELTRHKKAMGRISEAETLFLEVIRNSDDSDGRAETKEPRKDSGNSTTKRKARIVNLGTKGRSSGRAFIGEMILTITKIFQMRNVRELVEKKKPGFKIARSAYYKVIEELIKSGHVVLDHEAPKRSGGNFYRVIKPS